MSISKTSKCTKKGYRKWEIESRRRGEGNSQETAVTGRKRTRVSQLGGKPRAGRGIEITLEAFDTDIVGFSLLAQY